MDATSVLASLSSRGTAAPASPSDRWIARSCIARRAGERAVQQLAYEEGARLYEMALWALTGASGDDVPGPEERTEVLLALGDAQGRAGDTEAAKATFLEAADLARQSADAQQFASAALGYGGRFVWWRAARIRRSSRSSARRSGVCPKRTAPYASGCSRVSRALAATNPRWRPRDRLSAEAVAIAARIGDSTTSAYALIARGMAIWGPRAAVEMRELAEEAMGLAERVEHQEYGAAARLLRCWSIFATGPAEQVRPRSTSTRGWRSSCVSRHSGGTPMSWRPGCSSSRGASMRQMHWSRRRMSKV